MKKQIHHPIQPVELDSSKVVRFKQNAIVQHLLDFAGQHGCNMNTLAALSFSREDRQQFAQLIGYSVSGYSELNYVDDDAMGVVDQMVYEGKSEEKARIAHLEAELKAVRKALRKPMARLFGIHPDDLHG
jgi:hypothetical protein